MARSIPLLAVLLIACSPSDDGCPEGTSREGEEPPRGFEITCKKPSGEAHGPSRKWHMNGKVERETGFRDGKEHGVRTEYDRESGKKVRATEFADGKRDGTEVEWYGSGQKKSETRWAKGKREGPATTWYEDGKKSSETVYAADQPVGAPKRWYESGLLVGEIEWVKIPGGTFTQGAPGERNNEPKKVTVEDFRLSRTEVTVDQYRNCMEARVCTPPKTGPLCNWSQPGLGAHPINCVDWDQASRFAEWAKARLPTEAEWEYAARGGGKQQTYPWGDTEPTCEQAVVGVGGDGCGKGRSWPVCSKAAGNTTHGVCDMAGNVWEWVADAKKKSRVFKGGSFNSHAKYTRATTRRAVQPSMRTPILGFRVAR